MAPDTVKTYQVLLVSGSAIELPSWTSGVRVSQHTARFPTLEQWKESLLLGRYESQGLSPSILDERRRSLQCLPGLFQLQG